MKLPVLLCLPAFKGWWPGSLSVPVPSVTSGSHLHSDGTELNTDGQTRPEKWEFSAPGELTQPGKELWEGQGKSWELKASPWPGVGRRCKRRTESVVLWP